MTIYETILATYPELTEKDFHPMRGVISLEDHSDGEGVFIAKWNYSKPIPDGLKLGK
jgi:hypothetical protein